MRSENIKFLDIQHISRETQIEALYTLLSPVSHHPFENLSNMEGKDAYNSFHAF